MKSLYALMGPVFGLVLLLTLLAGGYFLVGYVDGVLAALEPPTRTLAIIGSAVGLLSAVIIAEGLKARGAKNPQAATERSAAYERLLSLYCEQSSPAETTNLEAARDLAATERKLVLQGSAEVISAYIRLKRAKDSGEPHDSRALLEKLVAQMRKDLGRQAMIYKGGDLLYVLGRPDSGSKASHIAHARVTHE